MMTFGFCAPIFAGCGDAHPRTPLLERADFDQLERAVLQAETLGYDSVWVADHLILGRDGFILEGWTVLSALARVTSRMRLGSIHLANRFRPPSLTAKMAATLDVISGGRLDFFFDPYAGQRAEADAYGLPTPDDDVALRQFEEAVELIKLMWSEESPSYRGKYYSVTDAVCNPKPVQRPSIPVWIGTFGGRPAEHRRAVSQIISRQADWWNITPCSLATMREELALLSQACGANGGRYHDIRKSFETQILIADSKAELERWQARIDNANPNYGDWDELGQRFVIGDVQTVTRRLADYADLGVECFMLWFMDYPASDGMRLFADKVMPHFR